ASPRYSMAALVGVCWSLAILSKVSALLFLPIGIVVVVVLWAIGKRDRPADANRMSASMVVKHGLLAGSVALGLIWLCYGFSVTYPLTLGGHIPVPGWELARGVMAVFKHNESGHPAYLLGEVSQTGWWYFFPVAIAVKTPLPFMFLILVGTWVTLGNAYRDRNPLLAAPIVMSVAMLLAVMPSNINIG